MPKFKMHFSDFMSLLIRQEMAREMGNGMQVVGGGESNLRHTAARAAIHSFFHKPGSGRRQN